MTASPSDPAWRRKVQARLEHIQQKYGDDRFAKIREVLSAPLRDVLNDDLVLEKPGAPGTPLPRSILMGIVNTVESIDAHLPDGRTIGARFDLDSELLFAISGELAMAGFPGRPTLIPVYSGSSGSTQWGHSGHTIVALSGDPSLGFPRIELIHLPGVGQLDEVDLRSYAWLYHELGHAIMEQSGDTFLDTMDGEIKAHVRGQFRLALADKGPARERSTQMRQELERRWMGSGKTLGWAGEIACDLLAIWAIGPAFLDEFVRRARGENWAPFQVTEGHPPYYTRAEALHQAAIQLGWDNATEEGQLRGLLSDWRANEPSPKEMNWFAGFTPPAVLQACVRHALSAWHELGVPRCDDARLQRLEQSLAAGSFPSPGTDLLIAAYLVARRGDTQMYEEWERSTLRPWLVPVD